MLKGNSSGQQCLCSAVGRTGFTSSFWTKLSWKPQLSPSSVSHNRIPVTFPKRLLKKGRILASLTLQPGMMNQSEMNT